jgi:hypothetical protein
MQDNLQKRVGARDGIATRVGLSTTMMGAIIAVLAVVVLAVYALGPLRTETTSSGVSGTTVGQNSAPVVPSTTPNNSKTTK